MNPFFEKYHHARRERDGNKYHLRLAAAVLWAVTHGQIKQHRGWLASAAQASSAFTLCILEDDDGNEVARGYAFCGDKEQFCRATGRSIALGRAEAALATSVTV